MGLMKMVGVENDGMAELRQVSAGIDEFLANKHYLAIEDMDEDVISQEWLNHRAHKIALEELKEMGLEPTVDKDELLLDGHRITLVRQYRKQFDGVHFSKVLKEADDSILASLSEISSTNEEGEGIADSHRALLEMLSGAYPTNDVWMEMLEYSDLFSSNNNFVRHIEAIIAAVENEDMDAVLDSTHVNDVMAYLHSVSKHRHDFNTAITHIIRNSSDVDRLFLMESAQTHDLEFVSPSGVSVIGGMFEDFREALESNLPFIYRHKTTTQHHLEYYSVQGLEPTVDQLALLVADLYNSNDARDLFMDKVKSMLDESGFGNELRAKTIAMAETIEFQEGPISVVSTPSSARIDEPAL